MRERQDERVRLWTQAERTAIGRPGDNPRSGWAEDAAKIAAAGDDGLVWPEIVNEEDDALTW